ncbi:DUF4062 domain-containing protein [Serratia sp. CY47279]|uniref:DUF4062 domain-containing protein n=1 Tax=Serratia sp. CY47279 TaxID=3383624 RepID=UPI003FA10BB9
MEEKKYQIFVSSTFTDLEIARRKVIDMILSLYHFPVGMEMFSADDGEQWQTIEQAINFSDYYVVIIGHRYGALASDGYSYTEKEYDLAKANGVPILAFIRNRDIPLRDGERETTQSGQDKLDAFINKAKASKMCDFWSSHEELVGKVSVALHKIFHRNPRIGWIRSSGGVSKETTEELARLSHENRVLREKLFELEEGAKKDHPNLLVSFNDSNELSLSIYPEYKVVTMPREVSLEDIPEEYAEFVTEKSINEYNSNIPTPEALERYNNLADIHHKIVNNRLGVVAKISNSGRVSASNVNIEVDFPDFVMVLDNDAVNKSAEPKNIIPTNPVTTARARRNLSRFRGGDYSSILGSRADVSLFHDISPLLNVPKVENINYWLDVSDGRVDIFEKKIMHTKTVKCDEFSIIPKCQGKGFITIKVICEEYKEQTIFEVPIVVN